MEQLPLIKKMNETYLYNLTNTYNIQISKAIIESTRYETNTEAFSSIKYDVSRRQTNAVISKILSNPDVILYAPIPSLPKAMKVFTCKDIKDTKRPLKVFIDISEIISMTQEGLYKIINIDRLISYLVSAMVQLIYNIEPTRITSNAQLVLSSTSAFSQMVTYIIDYLYKISNTEITRDICRHVAAMYYQVNILRKDLNSQIDSIQDYASKISKLNERQKDIVRVYIDDQSFFNIKTLIETMSKILKIEKLTTDVFISKWIYIYGTGTQFGLEFLPSFSDILTNAYCGSYINQQKTIEKVVGKDISEYSIKMISLGGSLL